MAVRSIWMEESRNMNEWMNEWMDDKNGHRPTPPKYRCDYPW